MRYTPLVVALGLLASMFCARPAHAQGYGFAAGNALVTGGPAGLYPVAGTVGVYPYTHFVFSAGGASVHFDGGLIAGEAALGNQQRLGGVAVGGWFFEQYAGTGSNNQLFEGHARASLTKYIGVQGGILGYNKGGPAYDAFAVGTVTSSELLVKSPIPWAVQIGAGAFIDPSGGTTTADFTAFVAPRVNIFKRLHADLSYWYVQDRGANFDRLAIGLGYDL